ncbi:hypothetical protein KEJ33_06335, partial [Candidatus Bathyarchaeota archaeon]|nr:hypothetical protein [Candidatus Bathyarchaeota archaeon]
TCRCGEEQANGEGQEQANGEGQKGDLIPVEGVMPPYVPLFHILGIPETSYLRTAIGEKYEYGAWYIDKDAQTLSYKGENLAIEVAKFTLSSQGMIRIVPEQTIRGFIPTVLYVNNLRFYGNLEYYPKQQTFFIDQDYNSTYKVFFTVYYFNGYLLKNAELVIDNDYLQLPDNITNRTKELAYSITQGIETPYQKICALESYLRQNYEYDIDYNRAPDGWEPIDWFLFEEKKGVCTQFNTALAILARSVGIPCRVVVGYLIDAHAEKQTVYADQAHLYVEVGFRELGWVQFDATPSGACRCRLSDLLQDKIKTFTKITEASMVGVKGHEFYVQGTVVDERGERVSGLAVLIYLKRFPSEEGTLCGSGIIKGGEFKITGKTPIEVDIGNYWIIAHTIGNEEYMDSWSEDIPSLGAWATVIPNIDGILSSEEWSDASSKEFILNIQGEVKRAQIFVKNDRTNLYIMLVIFDINYSPNDCVWFIFDNDNDGISEDKDDLLFITASGTYADCYLSVYDASYLRVFDNSDDGTNDLMASVRHTKRYDVGDYVFELSRPLNSFDIKHDFVLPLDNKIQFRLEFNYTFNGGYYSISWPCPSVFAEIKAIAPRLSTFTEMTSASQTCARGDVFYAEGKVIDQNGLRVDGLTVKVYLKRSKESNDSILCGIGTVESGFFRIICKAPSDLIVGDYFLVAQTIENDRYEGSWSDPPIKIMARTELVLSAPREVAVGRTFTIHGGLVENETGQSIPSETVTLCLGSEKLIDLLTDENGQFEFSYTIYEPGNYTFNVVFLGSDYYFGSESAVIIKVLLPSFIINTNNVLVRLKNYDIAGRVFIGDSPLAYTQISIFFDGKPIATVNCDNEGSFKVKYT